MHDLSPVVLCIVCIASVVYHIKCGGFTAGISPEQNIVYKKTSVSAIVILQRIESRRLLLCLKSLKRESMSYRLVARGSSETMHSADIERVATLSSSSCISDRQMTQYSNVQRSAVRKPNGGGMPRLPQRGRFNAPVVPVSETSRGSLLSRVVVPDSGRLTTSFGAAARAYGADWKKDTERLDSGFEEQQHSLGKLSLPNSLCGVDADADRVNTRSATVVTSSAPVLKSRCIEDDGAPVIPVAKTIDTGYFHKSEPTFPSHMAEKPNVVPSPAIPTSTAAAELYRQHMEGLKQQAAEWLRLQKGLELLLPNTDGDT